MAFSRQENIRAVGGSPVETISYIPEEPHPWLKKVEIEMDTEGLLMLIMSTRLKDSAVNETKIKHKLNELDGLKRILTLKFSSDQPLEVTGFEEAIHRMFINEGKIGFESGPASKVRAFLSGSDLPTDIEKAVMEDLEKIWARTPGKF